MSYKGGMGAVAMSQVVGPMVPGTANTENLLRACAVLSSRLNEKFAEYKTVAYADPIRRTHLRRETLTIGKTIVACLQGIRPVTASGWGALREAVAGVLANARFREQCYRTNAAGCGRFGMNEPAGADKAAEEQRDVIRPLTALAASIATSSVAALATSAMTDTSARIAACTALAQQINAKFAQYKAVSFMDAVTRNSLRFQMLSIGRQMVTAFQSIRPTSSQQEQQWKAAAFRALSESKVREQCYRNGAPGCGRFMFNEATGAEKASQEAATIGAPLAALIRS